MKFPKESNAQPGDHQFIPHQQREAAIQRPPPIAEAPPEAERPSHEVLRPP